MGAWTACVHEASHTSPRGGLLRTYTVGSSVRGYVMEKKGRKITLTLKPLFLVRTLCWQKSHDRSQRLSDGMLLTGSCPRSLAINHGRDQGRPPCHRLHSLRRRLWLFHRAPPRTGEKALLRTPPLLLLEGGACGGEGKVERMPRRRCVCGGGEAALARFWTYHWHGRVALPGGSGACSEWSV